MYIEDKETSFKNDMNGNTSHIDQIKSIYSASIIPREISVCILLNQNTGHPAYIIIYPVQAMPLSTFQESYWSHTPEKLAST